MTSAGKKMDIFLEVRWVSVVCRNLNRLGWFELHQSSDQSSFSNLHTSIRRCMNLKLDQDDDFFHHTWSTSSFELARRMCLVQRDISIFHRTESNFSALHFHSSLNKCTCDCLPRAYLLCFVCSTKVLRNACCQPVAKLRKERSRDPAAPNSEGISRNPLFL